MIRHVRNGRQWCWALFFLLTLSSTFVRQVDAALDTFSFLRSSKAEHAGKDDKKPVKVVLLAGQSNMVGAGSVDHLLQLIHANQTLNNTPPPQTTTPAAVRNNNNTSNEYRQALWDEARQDFVQSDKVFVKFENEAGGIGDAKGPLTVGAKSGFAYPGRFGIEAMFGLTLEEELTKDETIYLLKTAWGGRSLAVDFRPPASGQGAFYDDDDKPVKPSHYGWKYRQMVEEIQAGLDDLPHVIPDYDAEIGYEIVGFVWFQGWNDMVEWDMVDEYAENLKNLIANVRQELDLPHLPVVVGELGNHGLNLPQNDGGNRVAAMRLHEESVALLRENIDNTAFVKTAQYAIVDIPEEDQYDGIHHYYGRAEPYFHIGQALAKGLQKLLRKADQEKNQPLAAEL